MDELPVSGELGIDFVWVQKKDLHTVLQFQVLEDKCRWSDHLLVATTFKTKTPINVVLTSADSVSNQKRWNLKGGAASWNRFRVLGDRIMGRWKPVDEGGEGDQKRG